MNDKRFQIFVSSTFTDLIDARREIINLVMESYNFPVGMEMFGADNSDQWTFIQQAIDITDIYILILGHRYGSLAPDGVGYTEKEFDYAVSKGIPVLSFIRHENVSTTSSERESDPLKIQKMNDFRRKASANKLCVFWSDINDLKASFAASFYKNLSKCQGVGWIRGSQAVSPEIAKQLVMLVDENRQLREENEKLKAVSATRLPELVLTGIQSQGVKMHIDSSHESQELKYFERFEVGTRNESLSLKSYLNAPYIEKYNSNLPSDHKVDLHNNSVKFISFFEKYSIDFDFFIENEGLLKATSISLVLVFPDFIVPYDKSDIESILRNEKRNILKPMEHPLEKAMREQAMGQNAFYQTKGMQTAIANASLVSRVFDFDDEYLRSPVVPSMFEDRFFSVDQDSNSVSVSLSELLHKRKFSVNNKFVLVPVEEGEGMIEISVMCAEYIEEQCISIPIRVSKI